MRTRLASLTLRGFKTIRRVEDFELGNLTILIGPNGAGKSNFLSFFRFLYWGFAAGELQRYVAEFGGASAILHAGKSVARELEAQLHFATDDGFEDYRFRLFHAAGDTLVFADEWMRSQTSGHPYPAAEALGVGHKESQLSGQVAGGNKTAQLIFKMLARRIVSYQLHNTSPTARIRNKWDADDGISLKDDGGNLAPFLYRLQRNEPRYYQRIVDTIRLILPFFATFELVPEYGYLLLRWREIGSDHVFNVSQASDGMLRVMALIALLQQPERDLPDVLILDEPELGLHPYAIEILAGLIKSAATHVQVIIATQSVSLIDRFSLNDIVVVNRSDGESTFRRLSEHEFADWLDDYTLSELWEMNVLGGRPSH